MRHTNLFGICESGFLKVWFVYLTLIVILIYKKSIFSDYNR